MTCFEYRKGICLSKTQSVKVDVGGSIALVLKMNFGDLIHQLEHCLE
jgi:hypothetical protein